MIGIGDVSCSQLTNPLQGDHARLGLLDQLRCVSPGAPSRHYHDHHTGEAQRAGMAASRGS
jgi:hypothetical protein